MENILSVIAASDNMIKSTLNLNPQLPCHMAKMISGTEEYRRIADPTTGFSPSIACVAACPAAAELTLLGLSETAAGVGTTAGATAAANPQLASEWVFGAFKSAEKWANQLQSRGWTPDQITEAIAKGQSFPAQNLVNQMNSATRFVHPTTGQSVVIDNVTKEIIHVGGIGFLY